MEDSVSPPMSAAAPRAMRATHAKCSLAKRSGIAPTVSVKAQTPVPVLLDGQESTVAKVKCLCPYIKCVQT